MESFCSLLLRDALVSTYINPWHLNKSLCSEGLELEVLERFSLCLFKLVHGIHVILSL